VEILSQSTEKGVVEQRFDLHVDGAIVPGIRWCPERAEAPRPTILIGHGGTQHKRVPNVLGLARRFVRHLGYVAVALDAPGHGERVSDPTQAARRREAIQARIAAGPGSGGISLGPNETKDWIERTTKGIAEWHALLDTLEEQGQGSRYGYWGVSMGTVIGLPFVASEPRIGAAVLGLAGLGDLPGADRFAQAARALTVPVLLVLQGNDELVDQTAGLALFDAIGSSEKTVHINPGGHVEIPLFERDAYEAFFRRHLGPAGQVT
jgi:alpha-beta hydrolase superfamily lysophospholipase